MYAFPGMEPTNNLGEQAMRGYVIMRKIIGDFRSENGAENINILHHYWLHVRRKARMD